MNTGLVKRPPGHQVEYSSVLCGRVAGSEVSDTTLTFHPIQRLMG